MYHTLGSLARMKEKLLCPFSAETNRLGPFLSRDRNLFLLIAYCPVVMLPEKEELSGVLEQYCNSIFQKDIWMGVLLALADFYFVSFEL